MRLLKLVILGGLGYMLYKMFSDMPPKAASQRGRSQRSGSMGRQGAMDTGSTPQGPQMTGPGVGEPAEAYDTSGGGATPPGGRRGGPQRRVGFGALGFSLGDAAGAGGNGGFLLAGASLFAPH